MLESQLQVETSIVVVDKNGTGECFGILGMCLSFKVAIESTIYLPGELAGLEAGVVLFKLIE
jgi:hypothetical protein